MNAMHSERYIIIVEASIVCKVVTIQKKDKQGMANAKMYTFLGENIVASTRFC